ncbi:DUF2218 domain-containing protein [Corynebacterium callunae]|uniref:DUF2218 domain-containing protein n=1 Tax=Corynebacterium callunae TaxID=1721 RepID=UPI003982968B
MIVSSTARVSLDRPGRYAKQLTSHLGEKLNTNWDGEANRGSIVLKGDGADAADEKLAFDGTASCDLVAGDGVLLLHIEAPENLVERFESVIGRHLVGFGRSIAMRVAFRRGDGSEGLVFETEHAAQ